MFQKQVKLIYSQDTGHLWKGKLLEGARVGSGMFLINILFNDINAGYTGTLTLWKSVDL